MVDGTRAFERTFGAATSVHEAKMANRRPIQEFVEKSQANRAGQPVQPGWSDDVLTETW